MRASALRKLVCQGQRAGRCIVHCRGGAGDPAGEREQAPAEWCAPRGVWGRGGRSAASSAQVVREAAITVQALLALKCAGGEVRERLVFEVADDELNDGVLAMLCIDERASLRCGW